MLFGRGGELARGEVALAAARGGASRVLLVCGPAGIGKSALLAEARERARAMRVLEARGVEAESELAFAGLTELLGPLVGLAAGLPAAQAAAVRGALALEPSANPDRFAVGVATLGLLAAAAEELPLLVLVEDLHWLDAASGEALAFAARRLRAEPIALLVSCRDELPPVFEMGGFEQLVLGGLDTAAAAALVAERSGRPVAGGVVERLVAATGGNPLALGELAGVLTASQLAGRAALPDPLPARASAERLFADRIGALDPQARRALLLAAAAGEGEAAPVLAAGAASGTDEDAFGRVEASGLVLLADGRLGFCHPLVRSAAYAAGEPGERRAAHRALAESFSDDRRAWHLAAAALGADEHAASALEQPAERARRRGGSAAAAAALERAARLSADAGERARRLLAAADAARLEGRAEHALELLDEADAEFADDRSSHAAELVLARARIERYAGRIRDAWRHYAQAAELLQPTDPRQAAAALAHAALAALIAGDYQDAVAMAAAAHEALDEHSAEAERQIAALILGYALYRSGSTSEGFSLLMPAAALAERPHPDEPEFATFAAFMLVLVGEHKHAEAILERLIGDARNVGALGVLPFALFVAAYNDIQRGRWAAAYATASEAAELAETASQLWRCLALSALVTVEAGQGREQACRAHAAEAEQLADELGIEGIRDIFDALGQLELSLGRLESTIETLEHTAAVPGDEQGLQLRPSTPDLVEAYVRAGNPRAGRLAQLASEHTDAIDIPGLRALAVRCRGLVAPDGEFDRHFDDALRLFGAADLPFQQARTALNYGERLRRSGRRRAARAQLHAALETFNRLGAAAWADNTERELRATGERLRRRDPSAAEQLTAQELQVALAVASGATNREAGAALFLSHKTIEHHLGQIYRKLGLRSRTEMARAFAAEVADVGGASHHGTLARPA